MIESLESLCFLVKTSWWFCTWWNPKIPVAKSWGFHDPITIKSHPIPLSRKSWFNPTNSSWLRWPPWLSAFPGDFDGEKLVLVTGRLLGGCLPGVIPWLGMVLFVGPLKMKSVVYKPHELYKVWLYHVVYIYIYCYIMLYLPNTLIEYY